MDTNGINAQRIILSLPEEKAISKPAARTGELIRKASFIFCLILILISICAHIGIIAAFADIISDEDISQKVFLSVVLPPFTKQKAYFEEEKTEIRHDKAEDTTANEPADTETNKNNVEIPEKSSVSMNLAATGERGFNLKNETSYNPDLEILYNSPNPIEKTDKLYEKYTEDEPLVLIYHTHATESYNDTNDSGSFRSSDAKRNMIAVGETLVNTLEANGIRAIHLTEMFDFESYNTAYNKSHKAVEKIMGEYPSIKYVIDLHRDSVSDENGNCVSADFTYNGKTAAQIMFVVGTDEGGSGHTEWRKNMTTALHLQAALTESIPDSVRPINLRKASFYQDKSHGALLVEIGTSGNTLTEAKRSAVIFGHTLTAYITGKEPVVTVEELMGDIG